MHLSYTHYILVFTFHHYQAQSWLPTQPQVQADPLRSMHKAPNPSKKERKERETGRSKMQTRPPQKIQVFYPISRYQPFLSSTFSEASRPNFHQSIIYINNNNNNKLAKLAVRWTSVAEKEEEVKKGTWSTSLFQGTMEKKILALIFQTLPTGSVKVFFLPPSSSSSSPILLLE